MVSLVAWLVIFFIPHRPKRANDESLHGDAQGSARHPPHPKTAARPIPSVQDGNVVVSCAWCRTVCLPACMRKAIVQRSQAMCRGMRCNASFANYRLRRPWAQKCHVSKLQRRTACNACLGIDNLTLIANNVAGDSNLGVVMVVAERSLTVGYLAPWSQRSAITNKDLSTLT